MKKPILARVFWSVIILLSAFYLFRGIRFRFLTEGNLETKVFWYVFHFLTALAPLILGPFQFSKSLRIKNVKIHRFLGKIYLLGSLLGGISAFVLGVRLDLEGSIVSLILLSLTWIFMVAAAWITIRNGNIKDHRLFAIRSYGMALVFVFLRLIGDIPQEKLFFFIESPEMRDSTLEWISWIIPLLVIEFAISWIPAIKVKRKFKSRVID